MWPLVTLVENLCKKYNKENFYSKFNLISLRVIFSALRHARTNHRNFRLLNAMENVNIQSAHISNLKTVRGCCDQDVRFPW